MVCYHYQSGSTCNVWFVNVKQTGTLTQGQSVLGGSHPMETCSWARVTLHLRGIGQRTIDLFNLREGGSAGIR
jgi:hypothetical protein